jgi:hypothetical protein
MMLCAILCGFAGCFPTKPNDGVGDMMGPADMAGGLPCLKNADCPSELCWDNGLDSTWCVDEKQIAYVDATGCPGRAMQNGLRLEPYCLIQKGIESGLPFVLLRPGIYESVTIRQGEVTLVGPWANPGYWADPDLRKTIWETTPPAKIRVGATDPGVTVEKGKVVIDGLLIQGIADPNAAFGIHAPSTAGSTDLTVRRSVIDKATSSGVDVGRGGGGASFTMDRCRVSGTVRTAAMGGGLGIVHVYRPSADGAGTGGPGERGTEFRRAGSGVSAARRGATAAHSWDQST